jgi:hypothetical protein
LRVIPYRSQWQTEGGSDMLDSELGEVLPLLREDNDEPTEEGGELDRSL